LSLELSFIGRDSSRDWGAVEVPMQKHVDTLVDVIEVLELMRVDIDASGHYKTSVYIAKVIYHLNVNLGIVSKFRKQEEIRERVDG
jgi:hypothetical protein